jgi:hypothetical protein
MRVEMIEVQIRRPCPEPAPGRQSMGWFCPACKTWSKVEKFKHAWVFEWIPLESAIYRAHIEAAQALNRRESGQDA